MWEPQPLTPLWAFTACYRDSFTLLGETEVLGENLPKCHFFPPQFPHDLTWDRTRAVVVGSRRLTAWAMARSAASYSATEEFPSISWNQEGRRTTTRLLPTQYTNTRKTQINISAPSGIQIHDPSDRATTHIMRLSSRVHGGEIFRKQKLYNRFMLKGYWENYMLFLCRILCIWNSDYGQYTHAWPYANTTGRQKTLKLIRYIAQQSLWTR
jgi:hypothetical protein